MEKEFRKYYRQKFSIEEILSDIQKELYLKREEIHINKIFIEYLNTLRTNVVSYTHPIS